MADDMNVSMRRSELNPTRVPDVISKPRSSPAGRLADVMLGKGVTLSLAALSLMVGLATFIILARGSPLGWRPGVGVGLVLANLSVLLMLGAVLGGRLTRAGVDRRDLGCMCGWFCCSAAWRWRPPSSLPVSP
jgi:two-component system nitrogen regulation sensor histidine kinase NtrY